MEKENPAHELNMPMHRVFHSAISVEIRQNSRANGRFFNVI